MRRRTGFTLVELLVSMALIVFIMAILAEAFVEALKTFRSMKSTGDLNARLRSAMNLLQADLSADHFEGKRRLSDPSFIDQGPPQEGFFRLWYGSGAFSTDGHIDQSDTTNANSYSATGHIVHFTVKRRGNNPQDYFSTNKIPARSPLSKLGVPTSRYQEPIDTSYTSQWAEVAWFLRANGATTVPVGNTAPLPLYTLYRRQRVVVPSILIVNSAGQFVDLNQDPDSALPFSARQDYLGVSTSRSEDGTTEGKLHFNSPRDLTIPERRFGMLQKPTLTQPHIDCGAPFKSIVTNRYEYPIFSSRTSPNHLDEIDEDSPDAVANPANSLEGSDVVATDVLSFCILLTTGDIQHINTNQNTSITRWDGPTDNLVRLLDTWSNQADGQYDYTRWKSADFSSSERPTLLPYTWVTSSGANISSTGLEISLRLWDAKTGQTRQLTIIQDM